MNILYLLIPLSLILLSLAVWAFFWAVRNDQFDDLEGPAYRILFEDEDPPTSNPSRKPAKETPVDDTTADEHDSTPPPGS
ncbi:MULTISPECIES: cbb3-type cytochrome oxidase assembly protein CcoS [Halomonas]|uniref:cbb3-type cytochrome oxidase assembly protein CcoS n=1 Tax=Halomonas TaxID=2745 RepID=UPI001A8CBDA5|nr:MULTISPECIES: cbb3-type cytochrome oxidase assembly protein CcoS [Halomonas]MBN8412366.1 cbb3-type cytochrome oxidase assembly protein CcoS [Halomonas litopenaei]MBY5924642.1 cbb3-type cytochrome oxidase assembly protein CcoS [Halomonas sp. DP4Y7-2]MBY5984020.1 cbb3-type cytochrome oxidase assembly protein CcoS [Halomonas sp. DP5Y7-2]MBY6231684.1 cbb3-type cytochrome oxidase assembly protein CcoS [Halomonas sp. DP4Y7-1]